jgi:hypothetical protein
MPPAPANCARASRRSGKGSRRAIARAWTSVSVSRDSVVVGSGKPPSRLNPTLKTPNAGGDCPACDTLWISDPLRRPRRPIGTRPSPAFGEKAGASMRYVVRNWTCRSCGRSNQNMVEPDGTATCEHCATVMRIQPGRAQGGETGAQLSGSTQLTP